MNTHSDNTDRLPGIPLLSNKRTGSADFSARLRIMASRQARRRRMLSNPKALVSEGIWHLRLFADGLAWPYGLPFAGGLAAAMFLFLTIAPAFPLHQTILDDVPVRLTTPATIQAAFLVPTVPPPLEDVILDVDVDAAGRVVDYVVTGGKAWLANPAARKSLEETLVCTRFTPATVFGQPQAGTVRITLRRSEMEVRG